MARSTIFAAVILCMASTAPGLSQPAETVPSPGEALHLMVGQWSGSGWTLDRQGQQQTFDVFETVGVAAGGHAVYLIGEGYSPAGAGRDGQPTHDAAGFITGSDAGLRMRAVTHEGRIQDVALVLNETGFSWQIDLGPGGHVAFSATVTADSWEETGAYCPPEGECRQTLFMRLERTPD